MNADKRWVAVVAVGVFPLVVRALLLPVMPAPQPRVQDEFSYLLAADTFLHGRLVNPEHPFATHFESLHILVRPKYVSIFPVAQGLALAAGKAVFEHPWAGVWVSIACMSAAICWALQGWLPSGWAFFGSWLFALRLGIFSYWMNSYWGGAVAACGGALVLGALPRMLSRTSRSDAFWMGIGLAILANSRPFEGFVFALLMLGVACWKGKTMPVIWPTALILAIVAAGMSYYFWSATGNPLMPPYLKYRATAASAPHFVFQSPRPMPVFHHETLKTFAWWELGIYQMARDKVPFGMVWERAVTYWRFFLSVLFTIPLVTLPWLWKNRDLRLLVMAAILFFLIALAPQVWHSPHYAAPATALVALIVTMGLQRIWEWRWRRVAFGKIAVWVFPSVVMVALVADTNARGSNYPGSRWTTWGPNSTPRAQMLEQLERSGGRHLVLVRYAPNHDVSDEWVYNGADIAGSSVVWVREMGLLRDGELLRYFRGRKVWLAEPEATPARIAPYPVDTVGDPDALKAAVAQEGSGFSCDQWNYLVIKATGLAAPDVNSGCVIGQDRSAPVSLEHWFAWLQGEW